jgi:phosphopantothenoylcysteine synthetase/decarboxylase
MIECFIQCGHESGTAEMSKSNILIGITGGIAAYKIADVIHLLRNQGHLVQIVMTEHAKQFITPLTLQTLSGRPVYSDLFDTHFEHQIGHIQLARWADIILAAPASANFVARLSARPGRRSTHYSLSGGYSSYCHSTGDEQSDVGKPSNHS